MSQPTDTVIVLRMIKRHLTLATQIDSGLFDDTPQAERKSYLQGRRAGLAEAIDVIDSALVKP